MNEQSAGVVHDTGTPVKKPSAVRNILTGIAFIALYFLMQNAVMLVFEIVIMGKTPRSDYESEKLWEKAVTDKTLSYSDLFIILATIVTLLVIFLIYRKNFPQVVNIRKIPFKTVLLGFVCGISCSFSLNLFFALLPEKWLNKYNEDSAFLTETSFPVALIATVIAAPLIEEVIFRGIAISKFRKVMPTWLSVLAISVVFGVMHGNFVWFIYTFALGCGMGFVFVRQDSLWASIAIHVGFNSVGMLSYAIRDLAPSTEYYVNIVYEAVTFAMIPIAALTLWLLLREKIGGGSDE